MAARALTKATNEVAHLAKESAGFLPWAGPGAVLAGWMIWPGLTPAFKEETLGLKTPPAPGSAAASAPAGSPIFRGNGKYKYVKNEIGERPSLAED